MKMREKASSFLRSERKTLNLTIVKFAELTDVSRSYMQDILKGTANLTLDTVEHIANQLDIDPLIMLSYNEDRN